MTGDLVFARLLTEAPASLFYHLMIGLALEALLLMALAQGRWAGWRGVPGRLALAAGLGLLGRAVLFAAALGETWWLAPGTVLPPLERAVDLVTLGWLGGAMAGGTLWPWLPALHTALALGVYGALAPGWQALVLQDPMAFYALTPQDRAWMLWLLGLCLGSTGLLLSQRPEGFRGVGSLGFFALALGAILQLNLPVPGTHLAPWVRWGALTAYPLWLAGAYRATALAFLRRASTADGESSALWAAWSRGLLAALRSPGAPAPFQGALAAARRLVGARWSALGLLQEGQLLLMAREGEGLPQAGTDLALPLADYGPIAGILSQRQGGLCRPSDPADEAFRRLWQAFGMAEPGDLWVEPLIAEDRTLGAWLMGYPRGARPDPLLLKRMADHLALAVVGLQALERGALAEAALAAFRQAHEETVRRLEDRWAEERQALQREINRWATRAAEAEEERERWRRRAEELAQLLEARAALPVAAGPTGEGPGATGAEAGGERWELVLALLQELRTPLTAMLGYTDLLLGESVGILGATQRQFLLRIKANIERTAGLIRQVLQVVARDGGADRLEPGPVSMTAVRDQVLQRLQPVLQERGLQVDLEWPEDLPPVRVDPDVAEQILYGLLNNAALCSRPGTAIRVTARRNPSVPGVLFLRVRDTGGGIPPEEAARVFVPRYRAGTPLIPGVGDSIGLSIVRALVEANGGRIWVESEPGAGSTFTVVLPLAETHRVGSSDG